MKREVPDGSVVKFRHQRQYDDALPLPQGGGTLCRLQLPNGVNIEGTARCRSNENYSKRLGREISLGRALALAQDMYPELFKKEVPA